MTLSAAILGLEGSELSAWERGFFAETRPYGFILFSRNIQDPEQLRRLTGDLRDTVGHDAPILIDQEGGRVQRLAPPHWRAWLPPLDQMKRGRWMGHPPHQFIPARSPQTGFERLSGLPKRRR
ncbi:hypothetical protein [Mangrovicoccus ximenensis]|uniref:hypothetical protein n=1 Tax=Mangrovicoccus ximenensis TaxID=1911570 RepID=UPI000D360007